jgi:hypothetical protein
MALASSQLKADNITISIFNCSYLIPYVQALFLAVLQTFIMSQAGGDGDGRGLEFAVPFTMKVNEWKFRVIFTH